MESSASSSRSGTGGSQLKLGILTAAVILAIAGGVSLVRSQKAKSEGQAKDLLFQARKLEQSENVPAEAYAKLDVDAKLSQTARAYRGVIEKFPSTRSAHEARLSLATLYLDHGDAPKALALFKDAVQSAPDALEKGLAWNSVGYAQEAQGQFAEAAKSFETGLQSVSKDYASVRGDLFLSLARAHTSAKNLEQAKIAYERLIGEQPGSDASRAAALLKQQLQ